MIYNSAMNFKKTVKEGYNAIANRYLAERTRYSEDVRLLDDFMERLPPNAKVLDAGCGFSIIWSKQVADESCEGSGHLFVLVQK